MLGLYEEWEEYPVKWEELGARFTNYAWKINSRHATSCYRVSTGDNQVVACLIDTPGDDGWLVIFDKDGQFLTIGQTYIEEIVWAEQELVQQYGDWEGIMKEHWGRGLPGFWAAMKRVSERHKMNL